VARELEQVRIQAGLWERSTAISDVKAQRAPVELVDRMRQRNSVTRYCITPEQAAQPSVNFLAGREGSRCTSRSFAMRDSQMSGEMSCSDPRSGERWDAGLQGRYASSSYELEMVMVMPNPWDPTPMQITSRTSGRRIGACEDPEAEGGAKGSSAPL
jgi:hypothetical protein